MTDCIDTQAPDSAGSAGTAAPGTASPASTHRAVAHRPGGGDTDHEVDRGAEDIGAHASQRPERTPPSRTRHVPSARPGARARDELGRFVKGRRFEPLPDLVAGLSAVAGGLGVPSPEAFTFAGISWTPADAGIDGSPIGFRLASELDDAATRSTQHRS